MDKRTTGADARQKTGKTDTRRSRQTLPLRERLRPLQERIASRPATGLAADKDFFDELNGKC
jgi:antitoxin VapB